MLNDINGVWVVIFISRNCLCIDLVRVDEVLNISQLLGACRNQRYNVLLENFERCGKLVGKDALLVVTYFSLIAAKFVDKCIFFGLKTLEVFLVTGQDELELIG